MRTLPSTLTIRNKVSGLSLFTNRPDVLPQVLVKSRSCEIGCYHDRIAQKFDKHPRNTAAEMPVKFQSDCESLNPNLVDSELCEILR